MTRLILIFAGAVLIGGAATLEAGQLTPPPPVTQAVPSADPPYLRDRGPGLPTSMFGTYIKRGELIVYPFYEYYRDRDFEYKPSEFGAVGDTDFRGGFRANEGIFLISYGLTDNVSFEVEMAVIKAVFTKAAADLSTLPAQIVESGLGDVEGQLRWRWRKETERRPEVFSYVEIVAPHAKDKNLIGTPGVEVKFGTGIIRGFRWGTMTFRGAVEFSKASDTPIDLGEYAVEYLKQVSPRFRIFLGIEGTQDEVSAIAEAQWRVARGIVVKLNLGRGLTSKATDWAPEIGILFSWPGR